MSPRIRQLTELAAPFGLSVALIAGLHAVLLAGGLLATLPSPSLAAPMAGLGGVVGMGAAALLFPVIWLGRRAHPAWAEGRRLAAGWCVALGASTAVIVALIAERLLLDAPFPGVMKWTLLAIPSVAFGAAAAAREAPDEAFMRRAGLVGGLLTPALVLGALSLAPLEEPGEAPGSAEGARPDLLLITVDTLRADRLGVYGHTGGLTPHLDALAAQGTVVADAVAASPWTVPSVAAILTGQSALQHGAGLVTNPANPMLRTGIREDALTLTQRLHEAGYATQALVANAFVVPQLGFSRGFQLLDNKLIAQAVTASLLELPLSRVVLERVGPRAIADYSARGLTDAALDWWSAPSERPRFLWVHYIDPHSPYQRDPDAQAWARPSELLHPKHRVQAHGGVVGERFYAVHDARAGTLWLTQGDRDLLRRYYDSAVQYVDQHIGRLLEGVAQDAPLIAMTADHGEELWDHGGFEHGHAYWREVVHVPMLLRGPGVPSGNTIVDTVGHVDLAPTLLDLLDLDPLPEAEGRSLMRLDPARSAVRFAEVNLYDLPAALAAEGSLRYILWADGREALFNVRDDPQQRYNILQDYPEIVERLRAQVAPRLEASLGAGGGEVQLNVGTMEGLRVLGYVN